MTKVLYRLPLGPASLAFLAEPWAEDCADTAKLRFSAHFMVANLFLDEEDLIKEVLKVDGALVNFCWRFERIAILWLSFRLSIKKCSSSCCTFIRFSFGSVRSATILSWLDFVGDIYRGRLPVVLRELVL